MLEVGTLTSNFSFYSVLGPFLRADEEIGRSGEVVYLFESKVVNLNYIIFQVQDDGADPLSHNDTPNAIAFCNVLFF